MHLILIGYRASGKTTIGRLLTSRLSMPFVDLDDRILACFSESTVREVWDCHGEAKWRDVEMSCLEVLMQSLASIIALGGGAPMTRSVQAHLHRARASHSASVVYLECDVRMLSQRLLEHPGDRPSLTGALVHEEVASVLADRVPIYQSLADATFPTGESNAAQIADLIADWWQSTSQADV